MWHLCIVAKQEKRILVFVYVKTKPAPSSSLTDSVDMSSWWPKPIGKDEDKAPAAGPVVPAQSLSVVSSGSSQPGSAPPSLPQSPSARRGVNLLDEVVSLPYHFCL